MKRDGDGQISLTVPSDAAGKRLDRWLAAQPGLPTRSQIARAFDDGRVDVDGRTAKASLKLRGGESVTAEFVSAAEATRAAPEAIEIDVLYEDESIIAVNKAPGMVVHPAAGHREGTLVNALLHRFGTKSWPGESMRAGVVHRLDRFMSGVILVARDAESHEALGAQFRARTVDKHYDAIVRGDVKKSGEVDSPIGRHARDRKRMSTVARRSRPAATTFEPVERFGVATHLDVRPKTGRTHQIRVHLASLGCAIVADPVYGVPSARALTIARKRHGKAAALLEDMPRQALHARRISVDHPRTGKRLTFEAPMEADMKGLIEALRREANKG